MLAVVVFRLLSIRQHSRLVNCGVTVHVEFISQCSLYVCYVMIHIEDVFDQYPGVNGQVIPTGGGLVGGSGHSWSYWEALRAEGITMWHPLVTHQ